MPFAEKVFNLLYVCGTSTYSIIVYYIHTSFLQKV